MGLRSFASMAWPACATVVFAAAATDTAQAAELPRVQVRGIARVDVRAARSAGMLVLSGVVSDDLAAPVVGASVVVTVTDGSSRDPAPPARRIESCNPAGDRIAAGSAGGIALPTDSESRFCVRLLLASGSYVARFEVLPSAFLDGTTVDLALDPARKAVTLRFDPEPSTLDIDGDALSVDAVATTEENGEVSAVPGILLRLSNEADVTLATATTSASGGARLRIAGAELGSPGRGELRVTFAGDADFSMSQHANLVERRTHVRLEGPSATDPIARTTETEDQVTAEVRVVTACAVHGCPASPTGSVAMYRGDKQVGVAPIARGQARVAATQAREGRDAPDDTPLRLRYLPDAPWFVPAYDVLLPRRPRPTSVWGGLLMALAGLGAAAWVVAARWRPRDLASATVAAVVQAPVRAGVMVVRASAADPGLAGRVVDAHEGEPVAAAQVRLERAGFQGTDVISQVSCDAQGRFELPLVAARPGDELVVESGLYCTLRSPVSGGGEIEIALILRRRQLIEDLVRWARRRGGRFDARPEPTPGFVRRAAGDEPHVATWADALERAVYGREVVDEEVETRIRRLAPSPGEASGSHGGPGGRTGSRRGT
jgi:hypothetical protein